MLEVEPTLQRGRVAAGMAETDRTGAYFAALGVIACRQIGFWRASGTSDLFHCTAGFHYRGANCFRLLNCCLRVYSVQENVIRFIIYYYYLLLFLIYYYLLLYIY